MAKGSGSSCEFPQAYKGSRPQQPDERSSTDSSSTTLRQRTNRRSSHALPSVSSVREPWERIRSEKLELAMRPSTSLLRVRRVVHQRAGQCHSRVHANHDPRLCGQFDLLALLRDHIHTRSRRRVRITVPRTTRLKTRPTTEPPAVPSATSSTSVLMSCFCSTTTPSTVVRSFRCLPVSLPPLKIETMLIRAGKIRLSTSIESKTRFIDAPPRNIENIFGRVTLLTLP